MHVWYSVPKLTMNGRTLENSEIKCLSYSSHSSLWPLSLHQLTALVTSDLHGSERVLNINVVSVPGGSTENLLHPNVRRPNNLHLPASSSGDSLDLEIRNHDREHGYARSRKSRSMVASKQRVLSPVPAPRMLMQQHGSEVLILPHFY